MDHGDVRQWRFRAAGTQVRPGSPVTLHNDAVGSDVGVRVDGPAVVTLHRTGSSRDPVRGGERLAVQIEGAGYLSAQETGDPSLCPAGNGPTEWIVTGVAPGVAVPVDRPVALFDAVRGDHLVCVRQGGETVLTWSTRACAAPGTFSAGAGEPSLSVRLPMPPEFRPPDGVPGDAELCGAGLPVRDGDVDAGLLLLLDPGDARLLGDHLRRRVPDLAGVLAPEGTVGAVACRWSAAGGRLAAGVEFPPVGARVWVQGRLVAEPGVGLRPVRALAWAQDVDGEPVLSAPGDARWPRAAVTWRVILLPCAHGDPAADAATAIYLPMPGRDGEPGSATTFTPVYPSGQEAAGRRRCRGAPATAVVRDPRSGRRALRIGIWPGRRQEPVTVGCTVRVHLPA